MTPLSVAHTELRLFVEQVEAMHRALERAAELRRAAGAPPSFDGWEDLRTAAIAQLWETLERVETKLGLRLMKALYPVFETEEQPALPKIFEQAWPVPPGGATENATTGDPQA